MKNKIGFTLIELLAIIVLIGLIALVITPKIKETLTKQEMKSFETGVEGIIKAVKQDIVNNSSFNSSTSNYRAYSYGADGLYLTVSGNQAVESSVSISGNIKNGFGTVIATNNSDIILAVHDDKFCAKKSADDTNITVEEYTGSCINDEISIPEVTSCYIYDTNPDDTLTITGYKYEDSTCSKDLIIPNKINGKKVSKIANFAFVDAEVILASYIDYDAEGNEHWYDEFLDNIPDGKDIVWFETTNLANINSKYCYTDMDEENEADVGLSYIHTEGDGYYGCEYDFAQLGDLGKNNYNIQSIDFSHATELTEIPLGLAFSSTISSINIGSYIYSVNSFAFADNFISSLSIPANITSIGTFAFYENNINSLDLSLATSLKDIKAGVFAGNMLNNLTIKNLNNLESISGGEWGSFEENFLTSVTLENLPNLTNIGQFGDSYGPFNYNSITSLTLSNLPNLTTIGAWAFYDNKIASLNLVNSLTSIGEGAFAANNLTSVTIPSNVTVIDDKAFAKCGCGEGSDNADLVAIQNKTGRSFDWSKIIGVGSTATCSFITGTCSTVNITG